MQNPSGGSAPLFVDQGIPNETVPIGSSFNIPIPPDAFAASNTNVATNVSFSATLANGNPLPSWVTFNPITRTFSGDAPPGAPPLQIEVFAKDTNGDVATVTFTLAPANQGGRGGALEPDHPPLTRFGMLDPAPVPSDGADGHRHFGPAAAHHRWAWLDSDSQPIVVDGHDIAPVTGDGIGNWPTGGKPGLTSQLHAAGRGGMDAHRLALLESLREQRDLA